MDELLKALKQALLDAGLKEDSEQFKNIMATKFEGLKKQLDLKLPTSFDEMLKIEGMQSEFDKRQTQAIKTREDNLKKQYDFVEKKADPNNPSVKEGDDETKQKLDAIQKRLDKNEADKALNAKKETAKGLLSGKKIPESYLKHFDFNSETSIEDQFIEIEKEHTNLVQSTINEHVGTGGFPKGAPTGEVTGPELDNLVDSIT